MNDLADELAVGIAGEFGSQDCVRLAAGADAIAYAIDGERVLKIYSSPNLDVQLEILQEFYSRLDATKVKFAVPQISAHGLRNGRSFSIESRLRGTPLSQREGFINSPDLIAKYLDVASAIGHLSVSPAWEGWTLLGNDHQADWHECISEKLVAKTATLSKLLQPKTWHKFATPLDILGAHFNRPYSMPVRPVHGDLHPGNVLIDEADRVAGIIDFGSSTMFGDPAYDAATACGYFSMYEPDQVETRHRLLGQMLRRDGSPDAQVAAVYLVLAAVMTCDLYPDAKHSIEDTGHFCWALSILDDPALAQFLGR